MDRLNHDLDNKALPLLAAGDPDPVIAYNLGAPAPYLFICDHAGRLTPSALGDMGVSVDDWARHIAWDIGAAALTQSLAEAFAAPAILQRYSRLVIDCNRDPLRDDAIPTVSDGTPIPANAGLSASERARRVGAIHRPYHEAITAELDRRAERGLSTLLVCVHSFTPRLATSDAGRPWRFGVLHHGGSPASHALLASLHEAFGPEVGDNQPYAFDAIDYSAPHHALARGLDYVEIEVRQDLLCASAAIKEVCCRLQRHLPAALSTLQMAEPDPRSI